ncbi:MAG TPA: hypothetical protein VFM25_06580 [Verrucomicrobiae bacterium]|nr:hypothetical protein [Verrucomicrobiae bacterium]
MKNKSTCFASVLLLLIAGCATSPMKAAKKAGITNVAVEPRVDAREGMRYGVELKGNLANTLASIIVDSAGQNGIARMSQVMATNNIVVPEMVRESAVKHIQQCDAFHLEDSSADGIFIFSIAGYGFDNQDFHISKKFPFVLLHAELRDRKGKKLWSRDNTMVQLQVAGISETWDEFEAQPELLRAAWQKQIDNVVGRLIPCGK